MTSVWDSFGRDVLDGSITLEELLVLIQFLKDFDVHNNGVIGWEMISHCLLTLDDFGDKLKHNSITKTKCLEVISFLHDYDHANDEVLALTFSKDDKYWKKHHTFRNWKGVFTNGVWKRSKVYNEIKVVNDVHGL